MGFVIIIMGVSGVGKTTVGQALSSAIGAGFAEGDSYHPTENVEKMRRGQPLSDEDRWPWLDRLGQEIEGWLREDRRVVLACSALKASYRHRLTRDHKPAAGSVTFVYLDAGRHLIESRLKARKGHYMPASLLDSQLATLEPPADAITIDAEKPLDAIMADLAPLIAASGKPTTEAS